MAMIRSFFRFFVKVTAMKNDCIIKLGVAGKVKVRGFVIW